MRERAIRYLPAILTFEEQGIVPIRARLAERFAVSPSSVAKSADRLQRDGLITIGSNRTLELTSDGRALAASLLRRHRLVEVLLWSVIGIDWTRVYPEAERISSAVSDDAEDALLDFLGDGGTCPHGNPIPDDGPPRRLSGAPLTSVDHGCFVVERFDEDLARDPIAMAFVATHHLRPGSSGVLILRGRDEVTVESDGAAMLLPSEVARRTYVTGVDVRGCTESERAFRPELGRLSTTNDLTTSKRG